jgi:hypothetical protein
MHVAPHSVMPQSALGLVDSVLRRPVTERADRTGVLFNDAVGVAGIRRRPWRAQWDSHPPADSAVPARRAWSLSGAAMRLLTS